MFAPDDLPQSSTQPFLEVLLSPTVSGLLPLHRLAEVLTLSPHQIVPIPDLEAAVMGISNWRGEILWILDLSYFLGFEPLPVAREQISVLVSLNAVGALGLGVVGTGRLLWCDPELMGAEAGDLLDLEAGEQIVSKIWREAEGGEPLWVLDPEGIRLGFQARHLSPSSPPLATP